MNSSKMKTVADLPGIKPADLSRYFQICATTTMTAPRQAFRKIHLATIRQEGQPVKYLAGVL